MHTVIAMTGLPQSNPLQLEHSSCGEEAYSSNIQADSRCKGKQQQQWLQKGHRQYRFERPWQSHFGKNKLALASTCHVLVPKN